MMSQKAIDCDTNDPDQHHREGIENSVEDMHSDIGFTGQTMFQSILLTALYYEL